MNWFQKKLKELKKTDEFKRESAKIEAEESEAKKRIEQETKQLKLFP